MSRFVYILCIALLTASCVKVDSSEIGSGNTITFGTQKGGGTRAATLIGGSDTDDFRAEPFSVYGDWIRDNGDRSEVFHDVKVSYTTDAKAPTGWIYRFLLAQFHGERSLVGYSPWGRKESDTTEQLTHTDTHTHTHT